MATTQGNKALLSDIKSWYTTFNNLASKYSNGIASLTAPAADSSITAAQINNLHAKITSFRSDKYLGTKAAWWPTGTNAVKGNPIKPSNLTAILGVVSNATKVKCKNTANNSYGSSSTTCTSGSRSCSSCGNTTNAKYCTKTCSSVCTLTGKDPYTCNYGTKTSGFHNSGTACSSGTNTSGKKTCGTTIDISNSCGTKTKS